MPFPTRATEEGEGDEVCTQHHQQLSNKLSRLQLTAGNYKRVLESLCDKDL